MDSTSHAIAEDAGATITPLPNHIRTYIPFLYSVINLFTDRELKAILNCGDKATLEVFVEIATNIAIEGSLRPSESLWQQLRQTRVRNCIRQLVSSKSVPTWRRLLAGNLSLVRLLARSIIEQQQQQQQQE